MPIIAVAGGLVGVLTVASVIGALIARRRQTPAVANLNARIHAWWVLCALVVGTLIAGPTAFTVLFAVVSFGALREFLTLAPTRRADHHTLFWAFFVITPIQYVLVGLPWYGMFAIFIPVYAFAFIALRSTLSGDHRRYLERTAKIQWGLMVCTYALSHIPMLLSLDITGYDAGSGGLALWLLVTVQFSDVMQYVWGKCLGRHRIAPHLSPNKTWEGFLGGIATASALGMALWWLTPFTPWQALGYAAGMCGLGFAGGIVMSAVKRDAGVKDFGSLIAGHGGVLDRVDSLCLSAPVFFHLVRYYHASGWA